ncbi:MAG: hypothetical protein AABN34_08835 [Acidobacteriota bacterium]
MTSSPEVVLSSLAAQAFSNGYAVHGEVDLQFEVFESYLYVAIEKHLGSNAPASTRLSFVRTPSELLPSLPASVIEHISSCRRLRFENSRGTVK